MTRYDATHGECLVFTFKEGVLSAVAHDLKLRVGRFFLDVEGQGEAQTIEARFEVGSIEVVCAMRGEEEQPSTLGESDRRKIEQLLRGEVLGGDKHPEVRFRSTAVRREGEGFRIEGELSVRGATRAIVAQSRPVAGRQQAEITLNQPDFGIKPYSAMLGALRIRPEVRVRVSLAVDAG